jgi:hypothetical protein
MYVVGSILLRLLWICSFALLRGPIAARKLYGKTTPCYAKRTQHCPSPNMYLLEQHKERVCMECLSDPNVLFWEFVSIWFACKLCHPLRVVRLTKSISAIFASI